MKRPREGCLVSRNIAYKLVDPRISLTKKGEN